MEIGRERLYSARITILSFDDEHWTIRVAKRSLGHAAKKKPLETGSTVTAHNDHGGAQFLGLSGNNLGEVRSTSDNKSAIFRLEFFPFGQSSKVLAGVALQERIEIESSTRWRIEHLRGRDMQRHQFAFRFARQRQRVIESP
jgi:hypothetical protein